MTLQDIPRRLQRLIIVTAPPAGYDRNEGIDALLAHGYSFVSEVSESIQRILSKRNEKCHVISFGGHAFRDAGVIIASACLKFSTSLNHPLGCLDTNLGTDTNQFGELLDPAKQSDACDRFFKYLMDRTADTDTVILVTGRMVGVRLARYMCEVLNIGEPESNPLHDPTVDMRFVNISFLNKKVSYELIPVE